MKEVFIDACLDSLKIFPFLFAIYVLMEIIESAKSKSKIEKVLSGNAAPVFAGFLGAIPECGFSVMCAKLYDKGLITLGTLIAAFISVSDEGLIILISSAAPARDVFMLLGIKIAYAIAVGEIINLVMRFLKKSSEHVCPEEGDCIECGEHHEKFWDKFLLHPLFHAAKTFCYVFVFNILLGTVIYLLGEDNLASFMQKSVWAQPALASVIGLIPNCASSIVITKAFLSGMISFSALAAGLSANAGIGIIILFKGKKNIKKAIVVAALQFVLAIVLGYLLTVFGV